MLEKHLKMLVCASLGMTHSHRNLKTRSELSCNKHSQREVMFFGSNIVVGSMKLY